METETTADDRTDESVRVWLVERTYSDDEQNIVILVYATPDGTRYLRKERALTSFGDDRPTTAALDASTDNLGVVNDPETRERYATEATRLADEYDPDDRV
ncbi:hypothetical protein [Halorussus caseinilyticus]|uniref:DUF7967 domain-containing protein n=1 Tax=Halorussus caseinilyticus TaxID=3034025 RepID=A0ABD5WSD1_9EURY|nr:hypothetical protein [Halorussus sp. DT72]